MSYIKLFDSFLIDICVGDYMDLVFGEAFTEELTLSSSVRCWQLCKKKLSDSDYSS